MFRIGEFSKLTQVSIRMLRYYDEAGLLVPAETDFYTKYRLYSAEQIPVLQKIIFLRDLGFTVAEIAHALDHWDNNAISAQLQAKRLEIEYAINTEQEKLARIEIATRDILQEKTELNYGVSIKAVPSYQVFSLRKRVRDYYTEENLWKEMSAFAEKYAVPVSENTFSIYYDTDYRETDVDIEICAPVAVMGEDNGAFVYRKTEPVEWMACSMVYGSFTNIAGAYRSFALWLQKHPRYTMTGPTRQIVHRGPWNEKHPDRYVTEIQIPLEKK